VAYCPYQRKCDNENAEQWWHQHNEHLWLSTVVAGGFQILRHGLNEPGDGLRVIDTNVESHSDGEGQSFPIWHFETATPGVGNQAQSQADQERDKETYRNFARQLSEDGVPISYYYMRVAKKFTKTNKTVREMFDEMTLLGGGHENPSLMNARWIQEENHRENVQSAIDLLSF